jgi:hypothetical protein
MKKIKIISLLIASMAMMLVSCDEYENPVGSRGVGVVPSISSIDPGVFDSNNPTTTYVQFVVDVPEESASSVSEAIIQLSFNEKWERVEYSTITTFPATIKILLSDAASKLGLVLDSITLGDVVNIEVLTVTNGQTYRSKIGVLNAALVCVYDPDKVSGAYHSVSSDWGSEGDITITVDPSDEYTLYVYGLEEMEGLTEDVGPLKMVVNKTDYSVEAPRSIMVSSLAPWGYSYTNLAYGGEGTLNTCDGTYEMAFEISVDQGSFGTYNFVFTKK